MPVIASALLLSLLPVSLYLLFQSRLLPERPKLKLSGEAGSRAAVLACLLIPLSLLVLAGAGTAVRYGGFALTFGAAVYAAYWLRGKIAVAAVVSLALSFVIAGTGELRYDLVSGLTAIGGGLLLSALLDTRKLWFLGLVAAVDCAVVAANLTEHAVVPAAFTDSFPLAQAPPVFAGIALGGVFVGGIDLACALVVAEIVRERSTSRRAIIEAAVLYLCASAVAATLAVTLAHPLPATVPPLLAALLIQQRTRAHGLRRDRGLAGERNLCDPS